MTPEVLLHLQELLLQAVLLSQPLPGQSKPVRMPDLSFVMRHEVIYVAQENLAGPVKLKNPLLNRFAFFPSMHCARSPGSRGCVSVYDGGCDGRRGATDAGGGCVRAPPRFKQTIDGTEQHPCAVCEGREYVEGGEVLRCTQPPRHGAPASSPLNTARRRCVPELNASMASSS